MNHIENIVLSGGGVKGLVHIGALQILEELNLLNQIKKYCGSSIGGFICLLLNLEFNVSDIERLFLCINPNSIVNFNPDNINNLFDKLGCENMDKVKHIIEIILRQKTNNHNLTFMELYNLTHKELTITGSCISHYRVSYFNWKTTPNMSVVEALKITMCFPYMFEPIVNNNKSYVDGGVCSNFPIEFFKDEIDKTLGIVLANNSGNNNDTNANANIEIKPVTDLFALSFSLFYSVLTEIDVMKHSVWKEQTILINTNQSTLHFDIPNSRKLELITLGRSSIREYITYKKEKAIYSFADNFIKEIISSIKL
jgi:predicted acylesterase/phospholipase RssA